MFTRNTIVKVLRGYGTQNSCLHIKLLKLLWLMLPSHIIHIHMLCIAFMITSTSISHRISPHPPMSPSHLLHFPHHPSPPIPAPLHMPRGTTPMEGRQWTVAIGTTPRGSHGETLAAAATTPRPFSLLLIVIWNRERRSGELSVFGAKLLQILEPSSFLHQVVFESCIFCFRIDCLWVESLRVVRMLVELKSCNIGVWKLEAWSL